MPAWLSTSFTSTTSTDLTYRSSSKPTGTRSISPHQSGVPESLVTEFVLTMRSGSPAVHFKLSSKTSGSGECRGSPLGVPFLAQVDIAAISASLNDGSFLYPCMPIFFSIYQGGIAPARSRSPVLYSISPAKGAT